MSVNYHLRRSVASVLFGYLLDAIEATDCYAYDDEAMMPRQTIYVENRGAVISVTDAEPPLFWDAINVLAHDQVYDVVLIRTFDSGSTTPSIIVDICLGSGPCDPFPLRDLSIWRGINGELWLVPMTFGASVQMTRSGFELALTPPYDTPKERVDGVNRVNRDIVMLLDKAGAC